MFKITELQGKTIPMESANSVTAQPRKNKFDYNKGLKGSFKKDKYESFLQIWLHLIKRDTRRK